MSNRGLNPNVPRQESTATSSSLMLSGMRREKEAPVGFDIDNYSTFPGKILGNGGITESNRSPIDAIWRIFEGRCWRDSVGTAKRQLPPDPMNFLRELKRRNVYKVAVAYAVVGWLLIQAASILFPTFERTGWVMKVFVIAIAADFLALVVWAFELTPEGVKRTEEVRRRRENEPVARGFTSSLSLACFRLGCSFWVAIPSGYRRGHPKSIESKTRGRQNPSRCCPSKI